MSHSANGAIPHCNDYGRWNTLPEVETLAEFDDYASRMPREGAASLETLSLRSPSLLSGNHSQYGVDGFLEAPRRDFSRNPSVSSVSSLGYQAGHIPPASSASRIPVGANTVPRSNESSGHDSPTLGNSEDLAITPTTWLPYTLRWPFLVTAASISLMFSIILALLCWYSATHHGFGRDDDSAVQLGWRYTPTLLAVFFTQMVVMFSDEVKRTEPFSRLAQGGQLDARYTFLYVPKS